MDLSLTVEQQAFRDEVRSWLRKHVPGDLPSGGTREGFEAHRAWEQERLLPLAPLTSRQVHVIDPTQPHLGPSAGRRRHQEVLLPRPWNAVAAWRGTRQVHRMSGLFP